MLTEVNVENIQVDETSMLREVNVERCEVVVVNIYYFTACFFMDGYRGRIIVGFVFQNLLKKLLSLVIPGY